MRCYGQSDCNGHARVRVGTYLDDEVIQTLQGLPHLWHLVPGMTHTSVPLSLHLGHFTPFIRFKI